MGTDTDTGSRQGEGGAWAPGQVAAPKAETGRERLCSAHFSWYLDTMVAPSKAELPDFLRSADAFAQHLSDQLSEQDTTTKGDSFLAFACKALPLCDFWKDIGEPRPSSRKSHDKGVDFEARHRHENVIVLGQSKLKIREVEHLDSVLSKFSNYDQNPPRESAKAQADLFEPNGPTRRYVIVTSSKIGTIRKRYEESSLPSTAFYRRLLTEDRLKIVDGEQLVASLQSLYSQSYLSPPKIDLELATDYIELNGVFISTVRGATLRALYDKSGTSLFFENIRDFLGVTGGDDKESSVNDAIVKTLRSNPETMLARNNGITFRAEDVEVTGARRLCLRGGSIVNGCQTTMCIVNVGKPADEAVVMAKIVTGNDSWEVAQAANYQNRVTRMDLEIARFLRPQLVRKVATDLGYGMPESTELSISNVLDDIHLTKISYEAIKYLYLGTFSRHPNNIFEGNYSWIRVDTLSAVGSLGKHEYVMRVLFQLWVQLGKAREALQNRYCRTKAGDRMLEAFKRFFEPDKLKYQCVLAILAACGCVSDDLMERSSKDDEDRDRLLLFFGRIETVLTRHKEYFDKVFIHAFGVIAERILQESKRGDTAELVQEMFRNVVSMSGAQFGNICLALHARILGDDSLRDQAPDFAPDAE